MAMCGKLKLHIFCVFFLTDMCNDVGSICRL